MDASDHIKQLEEKILLLEIQIKHLQNDLRLTKEEYEISTKNFFDIYSNIEKEVEARTRDVKKLQDVLKAKGQELQIMLDSSPGMIFYKDIDRRYIRVNKVFSEAIGIPIRKIIGETYENLFPENQSHLLGDDLGVIETGNPILNKTIIIDTAKGNRQILINKIPYKDINGKVIGIIGFGTDVTDLIKAEAEKRDLKERLSRSQKMEALGLLAGGVAHDLNNVLSGIVSYPDLILLDLPKDSPLREDILTMQDSGKKAAAIVEDLLTLARRNVTNTKVLNINDILSDYFKSPECKKLKSYHPMAVIITHSEPNLFNIRGSAIHLKKAFMNLVSNAAEALPEGGKIIVSTENRYVDRTIKGYESIHEGDYVVVTVEDNGIGISTDDIERIFEPFYTKKVMGRSGTGLGMAVVWGTVQDHNGYINIESAEGIGTTFQLYFPVTREQIEKGSDSVKIETYMGIGQKILMVDDVAGQREIASSLLKRLNYEVETASSGEQAVEYMKHNMCDLLILDMIMDPGIDGLDTYRKILEIRPKQKAIIASGFSETDRVREAQKLGAGHYIKKPYSLEKLAIAVRNELEK